MILFRFFSYQHYQYCLINVKKIGIGID